MKVMKYETAVLRNFLDLTVVRAAKSKRTRCSICDKAFKTRSKYVRYCKDCREHSELYKFGD